MIELFEDYVINADGLQYILAKKAITKKGELSYKNLGYYSTMKGALGGFVNKLMKEKVASKEVSSMDNWMNHYDKTTETLFKMIVEGI